MKYSRNFSSKKAIPEGLARLLQIIKDNTENPKKVNSGLIHILYDIDILKLAYGNIKSNKGSMTPANTPETLDGICNDWFEQTKKEIRTGAFKFKPARRVEIPKVKGGTRPLGIPSPRDKIVQEAVRLILEAIYEPTFSEHSHGFRPKRGCHSAMNDYKLRFTEVKWFIEGDISKCFDSFDHQLLIETLKKRIDDKQFLSIIKKAIKAGYVYLGYFVSSGEKGTPQGSVVSPLLCNIFLDRFDKWMIESVKTEFDRGIRRSNPEYGKMRRQILREIIESSTLPKRRIQLEELDRKEKGILAKRMATSGIHSYTINDNNYKRMAYVRYADDFVIGIIGSKDDCVKLKIKIGKFLKEAMKLDLSATKTLITHATKDRAKFLGYEIHITPVEKRPIIKKVVQRKVQKVERLVNIQVSTSTRPRISAPISKLIDKLREKGYCRHNYNPTRVGRLVHYTTYQIVDHFRKIWIGLANYYSIAQNFAAMNQVYYILFYSCVLTLASKLRLRTKAKVLKKFKKNLEIRDEYGRVLTYIPSWGKPVIAEINPWSLQNDPEALIEVYSKKMLRTKELLDSPCIACGSKGGVEMHHVKRLSRDKSKDYLTQVMININRKQVPLCQDCHIKVHLGTYDGPNL